MSPGAPESVRHLVLMRHAEAESTRPGHRDAQRQLTERGLAQAAEAGRWLVERYRPDTVLCSPATRTRETLAELGTGAPAEFPDWLYDAGADQILTGVRALDPAVQVALVVGHAPGVPGVAYELTDPDASDPVAVAAVATRFPVATLAVLRVETSWSELSWGALVEARVPADG